MIFVTYIWRRLPGHNLYEIKSSLETKIRIKGRIILQELVFSDMGFFYHLKGIHISLNILGISIKPMILSIDYRDFL